MALPHVAPGKLFDACRYWYPEPQRTRKLILAGCGYCRLALEGDQLARVLEMEAFADSLGTSLQPDRYPRTIAAGRLGTSPDRFGYDSLYFTRPGVRRSRTPGS